VADIKWDIADAIVFGLSYILIVLCYFIIAIQVFLTVLEYYLITALSGIFIPFGIFPPTKFLAEKAIGAVVSAGVKMMVLSFLLAVVDPVLKSISFSGADITYNELWSVLLTAGAIAFLAWNAPGMAAGLLAGCPTLSAAQASQNTMAAMVVGGGAAAALVSSTRSAVSALGPSSSAAGASLSSAASWSAGASRGPAMAAGAAGGAMLSGLSRSLGSSSRSADAPSSPKSAERPMAPSSSKQAPTNAPQETSAPRWAQPLLDPSPMPSIALKPDAPRTASP
jgi:type IV secretion system protein TrbL